MRYVFLALLLLLAGCGRNARPSEGIVISTHWFDKHDRGEVVIQACDEAQCYRYSFYMSRVEYDQVGVGTAVTFNNHGLISTVNMPWRK